jgi:uncharacterized protein involved in type VI secretion and phage assembly
MSLYGTIAEGVRREMEAGGLTGVVVGLVSNNEDPDGMARVKLTFPWLTDTEESDWARVISFMAGGERGGYFLPEVGDEVLVAFEHGDINRAYVIGSLWNGVDKPPAANDGGKNNIRRIKSRSGHVITLDDTDGGEKIEIKDKSEKNSITWDTANNTITIASDKDIALNAPKGKITLEAKEISVKSSAETTIEAAGNMTLKGTAVNIN